MNTNKYFEEMEATLYREYEKELLKHDQKPYASVTAYADNHFGFILDGNKDWEPISGDDYMEAVHGYFHEYPYDEPLEVFGYFLIAVASSKILLRLQSGLSLAGSWAEKVENKLDKPYYLHESIYNWSFPPLGNPDRLARFAYPDYSKYGRERNVSCTV